MAKDDFNNLIDGANNTLKMPSIDLTEYESVECDKCKCVIFDTKLILKKIPGVLVGSPHKYQLYPDNVLVCHNCGTVMKRDRDYYHLNDDNTQDITNIKKNSIDGLIV